MYGAGDVRVEDVPDPTLAEPTDAVVRVLRACICGSDLWPYRLDARLRAGPTAIGPRVPRRRRGHRRRRVRAAAAATWCVAPFVWSDNTCEFCREGLQTSCRHGGFWGADGVDGGQAEAVRVPQAAGHPGEAARRRGLARCCRRC